MAFGSSLPWLPCVLVVLYKYLETWMTNGVTTFMRQTIGTCFHWFGYTRMETFLDFRTSRSISMSIIIAVSCSNCSDEENLHSVLSFAVAINRDLHLPHPTP